MQYIVVQKFKTEKHGNDIGLSQMTSSQTWVANEFQISSRALGLLQN